jgi:hypothetical protein
MKSTNVVLVNMVRIYKDEYNVKTWIESATDNPSREILMMIIKKSENSKKRIMLSY